MRALDMYWASNDAWFYFDGLIPKIKDDAPPEAKESFEKYLKQLEKQKCRLMQIT